MQVKASKTMCNELNKYFKNNNIPYAAIHTRTTDLINYIYNADSTGNVWDHETDNKTGEFYYQYISIVYPGEYYACNTILTTKALNKIFKQHPENKHLESFLGAVYEYCEI